MTTNTKNNKIIQKENATKFYDCIVAENYPSAIKFLDDGLEIDQISFSPGNWSSLTMAVDDNNIKAVKKLIALGANVNKHNSKGLSPISTALSNGFFELAEYLITKGASLPKDYLIIYAELGQLDVIKFLFANSYKIESYRDQFSLAVACEKGHIKVCQLLLDMGLKTELTELPCVDELRKNKLRYFKIHHPLIASVWADSSQCAQLLLDHGADPNVSHGQPHQFALGSVLKIAAEINRVEMVKLLVTNGAHVTLECINIVASKGNLEVFQFLVANFAPQNLSLDALYEIYRSAVLSQQSDILKFLVSKKYALNNTLLSKLKEQSKYFEEGQIIIAGLDCLIS